jgi:hypothetical protein
MLSQHALSAKWSGFRLSCVKYSARAIDPTVWSSHRWCRRWRSRRAVGRMRACWAVQSGEAPGSGFFAVWVVVSPPFGLFACLSVWFGYLMPGLYEGIQYALPLTHTEVAHGPGEGSGLLPQLPPPTCSRPVSGVGLGLFACGFCTAVSQSLLFTVLRSAIWYCFQSTDVFVRSASRATRAEFSLVAKWRVACRRLSPFASRMRHWFLYLVLRLQNHRQQILPR